MKTSPRDTRFLYELSRELMGLQDPFAMVRALAKHLLRTLPRHRAILSWPDTMASAPPLRTEAVGGRRAQPRHRRHKEIRFSDGVLTFIRLELHGPGRALSAGHEELAKQGIALVKARISASQRASHEEDMRRFASVRTLSAGFSHELNTPLNTLLVYLKTLEKEAPGKAVARIRASVDRMGVVLENFRKFSGDGDLEEPREQLLSEIAAEVAREFASVSGVRLQLELGEQELLIPARTGQLQRALANLVQNALDSFARTPVAEPWILLSAEYEGGVARIRVSDNGRGIAEGDRAAIFDPFFSTKDVSQGMGLGLSVARAIAFNHGGSLNFNPLSSHPQFVLELPATARKQTIKKGA